MGGRRWKAARLRPQKVAECLTCSFLRSFIRCMVIRHFTFCKRLFGLYHPCKNRCVLVKIGSGCMDDNPNKIYKMPDHRLIPDNNKYRSEIPGLRPILLEFLKGIYFIICN